MDKIYYVNVIFDNGRSICETFFELYDAVTDFEEWRTCSSVLEVTLEMKSVLAFHASEDDDNES